VAGIFTIYKLQMAVIPYALVSASLGFIKHKVEAGGLLDFSSWVGSSGQHHERRAGLSRFVRRRMGLRDCSMMAGLPRWDSRGLMPRMLWPIR
jgi:hypothetical protein